MKRGFILILIILSIFLTSNTLAEENELRMRVNTKMLDENGITINLTEFLGISWEYYLITKPMYVRVEINPDLGLAKIKALKNGTEVLIFTTNKSKEFSLNKTEIKENFQELIRERFNRSFDDFLENSLVEPVLIEKDGVKITEINFSKDLLLINLGNKKINVNFEKNESNLLLRNVSILFTVDKEDDDYLFYKKEKRNYFLAVKEMFIYLLIIIFLTILIYLIILLKTNKARKEITKDDFRKAYLNNLYLLKRMSYSGDVDKIFDEFSISMRTFLSKMLNIKYQFTYNELINELIIRNVDEKIKRKLIKFAKIMLEKRYSKRINVENLRKLINIGAEIIEKF